MACDVVTSCVFRGAAWATGALLLLALCRCSSDAEGRSGATGGTPGTGGGTGAASLATGGASGGASGSGGLVGSGGGTGGAIPAGGGPSTGGASTGGASTGGSDNSGGHGSGGATPGAGTWATRALAAPPEHMGAKSGSSGCTTPFATIGFEPVDAASGRHPLFLYFVGTNLSASDQSSRHDSVAAKTVTEAMARRGFVALSVQYDNSLSLNPEKLTCLYGPGNAKSVLAVACQLSQVNCDVAIATWGHSQGALMAHAASQFDARVRAVWTTGYSGGSFPLSVNRLRVVNGAADTMNSEWEAVNKAAGFPPGECANDGRTECLRPDGSGFILVQKKDCASNSADHCWFDKRSCVDSAITLEPNWTDAASTKPFALELNADWVAKTALRQ
jgi:hypothetical protein